MMCVAMQGRCQGLHSRGGSSLPSRPGAPQRPSRLLACRAEQRNDKGKQLDSQLEALDALLGAAPPPTPPAPPLAERGADQEQQQQGEGWFWWDRPAGPQTDPLRKTGMTVRRARYPGVFFPRACPPRMPAAARHDAWPCP